LLEYPDSGPVISTIFEDETIEKAVQMMANIKVGCLMCKTRYENIGAPRSFTGIVKERDIVSTLAFRGFDNRTKIKDVMVMKRVPHIFFDRLFPPFLFFSPSSTAFGSDEKLQHR
jgi:hypothetical protein